MVNLVVRDGVPWEVAQPLRRRWNRSEITGLLLARSRSWTTRFGSAYWSAAWFDNTTINDNTREKSGRADEIACGGSGSRR